MTSKHCTEDELTDHFYGDARQPARLTRHLEACSTCAALYEEIAGTLARITPPPVPARGDFYGLEVWQRIRPRLSGRESVRPRATVRQFGLTAVAATGLLVAMAAGRLRNAPDDIGIRPASAWAQETDPGDRVRVTAIADHLERSERLLLDLVNANTTVLNVSDRQAAAADLVSSNRYYRQAARGAGDLLVAEVLDDLERSLLDIVHGPSTLTAADLDAIRTRLDSGALIFRVRVLADELDDRGRPSRHI